MYTAEGVKRKSLLREESGISTLNGAFVVPEGASVTMDTAQAVVLTGAFELNGTLAQQQTVNALVFGGRVNGNGTLTGSNVHFWHDTDNCWVMAADDHGDSSQLIWCYLGHR